MGEGGQAEREAEALPSFRALRVYHPARAEQTRDVMVGLLLIGVMMGVQSHVRCHSQDVDPVMTVMGSTVQAV
jgi:hypothetical protein